MEDSLKVLERLLEGTCPRFGLGLMIPRVDWNDSYFEKHFVPFCMVKGPVEKSTSVAAARALLNWYMGGVRPENARDAILSVFYGMTVANTQERVFHENLLVGQEPTKPVGTCAKLHELNFENAFLTKSQRDKDATKRRAKRWYEAMWKLLGEGTDDPWKLLLDGGGDSKIMDQQMAINVIGFLYMNLLRSVVKDKNLISKDIFYNSFDRFCTLWYATDKINFLCPPSSKIFEEFQGVCRRFSSNCSLLLAAMVYTYGKTKSPGKEKVKEIMSAGCLLDLEKTGMGIFHWTQKASEVTKIPVVDLMGYMARRRLSNEAMLHLLTKHVASSANQYSWPWARIFTEGAFLDIAVRSDPEYAYTMVSLTVGNDPNSQIWQTKSLQVDRYRGIKERAIDFGREIVEDLKRIRSKPAE